VTSFRLPAIPTELEWKNSPADWKAEPGGALSVTAGPKTDWFVDPAGTLTIGNAPAALFDPPDGPFILSAKVTVDFASAFDAGALFLFERADLWAKLCFEFSPQGQPMVVSVVTRGVSDDCNSVIIDGREVYLRVARSGPTIAFHYSTDGQMWHFVRYFSLGSLGQPRLGFVAQSPTGEKCAVTFSDIACRQAALADLRSGE
jgi:hypothetical protein